MKIRLAFCSFLLAFTVNAQKRQIPNKSTIELSQFNGSILLHNNDIAHLITGHPSGFIAAYNKKTFGDKAWHAPLGYPDTGTTFVYQNMGNGVLGDNYALYAHYNFYFFKRLLQLRVGQGIAYNTNPYDPNTNFRNNAYGSRILSSTLLLFNYVKENFVGGLGVKAGLSLIHYSNANVKAPNTSTNTAAFNFGLVYNLQQGVKPNFMVTPDSLPKTQPIKINMVLRAGVNESDVIGSGQFGFVIASGYADKRLGKRSALQLGADYFRSNFLKELIRYQSIAFPENEVAANTDFTRVGLFLGHELFINKLSLLTQFGYYVYYPFDFEGRTYNRVGLKRYFGKQIFAAITLKSHAAKAEALEFGVGIRL